MIKKTLDNLEVGDVVARKGHPNKYKIMVAVGEDFVGVVMGSNSSYHLTLPAMKEQGYYAETPLGILEKKAIALLESIGFTCNR